MVRYYSNIFLPGLTSGARYSLSSGVQGALWFLIKDPLPCIGSFDPCDGDLGCSPFSGSVEKTVKKVQKKHKYIYIFFNLKNHFAEFL